MSLGGQIGRHHPSPAQRWMPPGPFLKHLVVRIALAVGGGGDGSDCALAPGQEILIASALVAVGKAQPPRCQGREQGSSTSFTYSISHTPSHTPQPIRSTKPLICGGTAGKESRLCKILIANTIFSSSQNRVRPKLRRTGICRP